MTTKSLAAGADPPYHFGFISHTNLAQFDSHFEHAGQILDQFPKIHPAVCCKVKNDLAVVEGVFHIDELHDQLVLFDLLQTKLHGLLLFSDVIAVLLDVLFFCDPHHLLQGIGHFLGLDFLGTHGHLTEFHSSGSFHHNKIIFFYFQAVGVEIVDLSGFFKSDTDYDCHDWFLPAPWRYLKPVADA